MRLPRTSPRDNEQRIIFLSDSLTLRNKWRFPIGHSRSRVRWDCEWFHVIQKFGAKGFSRTVGLLATDHSKNVQYDDARRSASENSVPIGGP